MTSRFKEALKMFKREYNSCEEFVNENAEYFPAVKQALCIADRLERGDVSDAELFAIQDALPCDPVFGCDADDARYVLKVVKEQLIAEEENG